MRVCKEMAEDESPDICRESIDNDDDDLDDFDAAFHRINAYIN
jgi:hypothetical protein